MVGGGNIRLPRSSRKASQSSCIDRKLHKKLVFFALIIRAIVSPCISLTVSSSVTIFKKEKFKFKRSFRCSRS